MPTLEKDILPAGQYVKGKHRYHIGSDTLDAMVSNFRSMKSRGLSVPLVRKHVQTAEGFPVPKGELKPSDVVAGEVVDLFRDENGVLRGKFDVFDEAEADRLETEGKYVSPQINKTYQRGRNGAPYTTSATHVALADDPVNPNQSKLFSRDVTPAGDGLIDVRFSNDDVRPDAFVTFSMSNLVDGTKMIHDPIAQLSDDEDDDGSGKLFPGDSDSSSDDSATDSDNDGVPDVGDDKPNEPGGQSAEETLKTAAQQLMQGLAMIGVRVPDVTDLTTEGGLMAMAGALMTYAEGQKKMDAPKDPAANNPANPASQPNGQPVREEASSQVMTLSNDGAKTSPAILGEMTKLRRENYSGRLDRLMSTGRIPSGDVFRELQNQIGGYQFSEDGADGRELIDARLSAYETLPEGNFIAEGETIVAAFSKDDAGGNEEPNDNFFSLGNEDVPEDEIDDVLQSAGIFTKKRGA